METKPIRNCSRNRLWTCGFTHTTITDSYNQDKRLLSYPCNAPHWCITFCAGLTAGLDMVLRALCIVIVARVVAGDNDVQFLVSGGPCPDVFPVPWSVHRAPELCAHPEMWLARSPPAAEPEVDQLVLWGETPITVVAAELPSWGSFVRINPLLPVTEPCGGSVSTAPFSFTNCRVLLVSELCFRLSCLMSSHSAPFSSASAAGDDRGLVSLSPMKKWTKKNPAHLLCR